MTDLFNGEYASQIRAAKLLGINPMTLSHWIKKYGIQTYDVGRVHLVNVEEVRKVLQEAGKLPAEAEVA